MPYTSTSTGYIAQAPNFNYTQALAKDIIGLGINGWGQGSQNSSPVTTRNRITRDQWRALANDVNFIRKHVLGSEAAGLVPSTGTAIAATITNAVGLLVDTLEPNRYVCHPTQFFGYPGSVINSLNGVSTSTAVWGREISQQVRVDWPTNLFARYFFNAGSVFTWTPSYASIADANDRDEEWVDFIDYLRAGTPYEYVRDDFLAVSNTKTTVYNSGSLSVTIIALRNGSATTATRVDFTAILRNEDLPYLIVDPIRGYWNYGPWQTP
jgi:hypothetical protein